MLHKVRNAMGGGVSFPRKKHYDSVGSTLLALRGGWVGVKFPGKKHYVTLEWPLNRGHGCSVLSVS